MKIMQKLLFILLLLTSYSLFGQKTEKYTTDYATYYRAEELFEKAQYTAARNEFRAFINLKNNDTDPMVRLAYYYEGLSALEVYNEDAIDLLEKFVAKYPGDAQQYYISFKIGNYFFQKEDFENAVLWFQKAPLSNIEESQKEEFLFKSAYSSLQIGDKLNALNGFRDVKDGKTQYAGPSMYFFSHLSYLSGALQVALEGFEKLKNDASFSSVVPYYIVQIYHKQKRFQEVIDYAPSVLDSANLSNVNDVYHLLGDAHYQLKNYKEAAENLEHYYLKAKTTREDDYQIGYSYYRIANYDKAIRYLDRVARIDDSLGQTAMYQIGDAFEQQNKLLPARNAFSKAAAMNAIDEIKEDALYNFAVLSFKVDINPYDESVRAFENYLSKYPESKRKQDIYQYLVNVYTNTSNYAKALESLDKLPSKDARLKTVYQTVAFNYGVELFQKNQYVEALKAFALVNKFPNDPQIVALAKYWSADIYYRKGDYTASIAEYKSFLGSAASNSLEQKNDAYYNLGYAYWNKDQMNDALDAFAIYLQGNPKNKEKKIDACLKLADGYYTTKQNAQAIKYYLEAIDQNSKQSDRATYYLARSYGYNGQVQQKINSLQSLIKNYSSSKYVMNATYELAKSYKSTSDFDNALIQFRNYISAYPKSNQVVDCRLEIADIHYKKWDYAQAELDYKKILMEYEQTRDVCANAVKGLMDVYMAQKAPQKASDIAEQYPCANISPDEKENLFYNPALQSYVDSNYTEAIPKFETYLNKFPNGRFATETQYFLGNAYYKTKDTLKAVHCFENYLALANSNYAEVAAYRVSGYYYSHKDYVNALTYYKKLELLGSKPAYIFTAKLGAMRCAFLNKNYTESVVYAKSVLDNNAITQPIKIEAEYASGMANYYLNNSADAITSLIWISKNTNSVLAAEARYTLAAIYFKEIENSKAETEINAILKMKPSYDYWVAKGLMLQSKIQISKEDYVQAEQNIKSIIDFYPKNLNDGILLEANELYNEIIQLQNPTKDLENAPEKTIEIKQD